MASSPKGPREALNTPPTEPSQKLGRKPTKKRERPKIRIRKRDLRPQKSRQPMM